MHRRHLPLKTWFMAVHIVTSHSNGISALQLQAQLGLGSYKSAWLLLHKLRRAMVDPDRSLLEDLIEIDEATLPFRTARDPATGGQGRSPQGKMRIAGAVELSPEGEPRRIRLAPIGDFSARSLRAFVAGTSAPGARVITDGWSGYCGLPDHDHQPKVVGATPAHLVLTWIHRVFSNLKRWALGTFHGLRRAHLRRYLDEFVFRWNRRRHTATAFDTLLGIGTRLRPADYRDIVGHGSGRDTSDPGRPGASHRPPSDPPQSEPNTGPPACLTALETNFLKSKSARTSPGTVRNPCLERRSPINIWCDRKQRDKPFRVLQEESLIEDNSAEDFDYIREARRSFLHHWLTPEEGTAEQTLRAYAAAIHLVLVVVDYKNVDGRLILNSKFMKFLDDRGATTDIKDAE